MLQSRQPTISFPRHAGFLHGPLTVILVLWAIAYPGLLLVLAPFGPIGVLVSVGAAILLLLPWLLGLIVLVILRRIT